MNNEGRENPLPCGNIGREKVITNRKKNSDLLEPRALWLGDACQCFLQGPGSTERQHLNSRELWVGAAAAV